MLFIRWPREAGSEAGVPPTDHGHVYISRCKRSRFTPVWNWPTRESEQLQELGGSYCDDQTGCTRSGSVGSVIPCFLSFCLASWVCTCAKLFTAVLVYPYHAAAFHLSGSWRKCRDMNHTPLWGFQQNYQQPYLSEYTIDGQRPRGNVSGMTLVPRCACLTARTFMSKLVDI